MGRRMPAYRGLCNWQFWWSVRDMLRGGTTQFWGSDRAVFWAYFSLSAPPRRLALYAR